jgi:hypothetical protein
MFISAVRGHTARLFNRFIFRAASLAALTGIKVAMPML